MKYEFESSEILVRYAIERFEVYFNKVKAEQYLFMCEMRRKAHPWRYFWRHILGGVWQ